MHQVTVNIQLDPHFQYNNCKSNLVDVTTGVPQGSILGPLLFSIFTNDLIHVTEKLKFIMYADDTTIYFNLEDFDPATIEKDINSELEKINVWLKLNKLSLNVKKTICNLQKQKQLAEITLSINGEDIENVEHLTFWVLYWMKTCPGKITLTLVVRLPGVHGSPKRTPWCLMEMILIFL